MMTESQVFDHFAARAFFASAWADQCEDADRAAMLSGRDILDLIPTEFDPAAWHASRTLRMDIDRTNGAPVGDMWRRARTLAEYPQNGLDLLSTFAHYCAMQAMGHGVGLGDFGQDCRAAVTVPYVEFSGASLEKDYF